MTEQHEPTVQMSAADRALDGAEVTHQAVDRWLGSPAEDPYRTCACGRPRRSGEGVDALIHAQCDQKMSRHRADLHDDPAPVGFWDSIGAAAASREP